MLDIRVQGETYEEVSRQLEAQPAARHARRNLEQVRGDALIQTSNTLLGDNDSHGIENGFVLVTHAGHGVDLKTSTENIAVVLVSTLIHTLLAVEKAKNAPVLCAKQ
jgi:hypothetical protein